MALRDLIPWRRERTLPVRIEDDPFGRFRHVMERFFDDFTSSLGLEPFGESFPWTWGREFWPQVNVAEDENNVTVSAELPGLGEKDIDVSISGDILTIRGEKKQEREEKERNLYRMERSFGRFERSIRLPVEVQAENAEAHYKNGVLTIVLPKTDEAKARTKKIEVKVE